MVNCKSACDLPRFEIGFANMGKNFKSVNNKLSGGAVFTSETKLIVVFKMRFAIFYVFLIGSGQLKA